MSEELKNSPIADFDWDAYEKGETRSEKSYKELEETYDKSLGSFGEKEVTEGTVISINKREVVVNIGAKSDGIIPFNEFRYNPDLKVGDTVERCTSRTKRTRRVNSSCRTKRHAQPRVGTV